MNWISQFVISNLVFLYIGLVDRWLAGIKKEKSASIEIQLLADFRGVRDEIRTHTAQRPLPPQSSVSTNSTTRTNIKPMLRAKNGTRTRDPNLGKVVLYQLSYFRELQCSTDKYF